MTASVPRMLCKRCQVDVPAGNYCGLCGCHPEAEPGKSAIWLRPKAFGVAPDESLLRPSLTTSLLPQLPRRSRTPFRVVLVIATACLLLSALLRLPPLGMAVAVLGPLLLFVMYLQASSADRDLPRSSLWLAGLSGALLGAGWVLVSGQIISRTYGVPMSVGLGLHHLIRAGFLVPAAGMVLMVAPIVLVRLFRRGGGDAMDGFVIGALAGLSFSTAANLVRLVPQIYAGPVAHVRPLMGLVVEVVLCGVTVPITATAAGAMAGIALWFREPAGRSHRVRLLLTLLAALALLFHAGVAVVEIIGLPQVTMLVMHLTTTLVLLWALRLAVQLALLHESHDPVAEDSPLLCPQCEMVVPDMAFCPACGAATRASSRTSRRERRTGLRPQLLDGDAAGSDVHPGYALPAGSYFAPGLRRPRYSWLLGRWGIGVTATAVVLTALGLALAPKIAHYMCPPDCGKPPTGTPVMALPRFEPPDGAFSVSYPAPGSAYNVATTDIGVTATYTGGDGGVMQLFSEPARGRSARDITRELVNRTYPDAKVAYEIPNAMVGYQPGYGEVADSWPQSSTAGYSRVRLVVMTAVKNDVALVAFATGPYHAYGPDFGPGPPSGANLELAQDMGKYVNSFRWKGDPVR